MRSAQAALNFISQQEHNRLIPFMHIIKDPDRDPTPSTCDAIVTLDYTNNQKKTDIHKYHRPNEARTEPRKARADKGGKPTTGIWTIPTADSGPETWAPTTGN